MNMIRDSLDLMNPRGRFTATATYYERRPDGPALGGQEFHYEYVSPYSKTYQLLFANVQVEAGETIIRTDDFLAYKSDGIVVTQDGKTFSVIRVERDLSGTPKQVMRLIGVPVSAHFVLRLIEIADPWGLA